MKYIASVLTILLSLVGYTYGQSTPNKPVKKETKRKKQSKENPYQKDGL